jgi:hypothetical protein
MNFKTTILRTFGVLCGLTNASCSPKEQPQLSPVEKPASAKMTTFSGPDKVTKPEPQSEKSTENLVDLKKLVQRGNGNPDTEKTIEAFLILLKNSSPVGKNISEVESIFGKVSRIEKNLLVYAFDTGELHFEWFFHVKEGVVSHVSQNHTLE